MNKETAHKTEHLEWLEKCLISWKQCEEFILENLSEETYIKSINTCRDALEMCSCCIKFEQEDSPFFYRLCKITAEIFDAFSDELSKYESKSHLVRNTIDICDEFSISCRALKQ